MVKPCVDCAAQGVTTKRKTPHPGPRCATHHRAKRFDRRNYSHGKHIEQTYGITSEEYEAVLDHQGRVCPLCLRARGVRKRLSVDHDHATGIVRGLICGVDNKYLGHARDQIEYFERCIEYLKNPPAVQVIGKRITPDMAGT